MQSPAFPLAGCKGCSPKGGCSGQPSAWENGKGNEEQSPDGVLCREIPTGAQERRGKQFV